MEYAIKSEGNNSFDDPSANCHMSETRYKNTQKYIEKLLKNYREKQIKKGSVDKPKLWPPLYFEDYPNNPTILASSIFAHPSTQLGYMLL